ncbi:hypothetical protein ACT3UQ_05935 [Glutamicibacter sp. AOP12-B1-11]|uniref:hypothetical protein n=1 Tax=Micrococcaceae TaxID=1268 RepID=UPI0015E473E9|nr:MULTISPECIES: hypothetical protein [unclassified Arthrobacter]
MKKSTVSPTTASVLAALFLLVGVWQLATGTVWPGGAMLALASLWVVVAVRQARKPPV